MMKLILSTLSIYICTVSINVGFSQTVGDALRYSTLIPGGTARVIGAGSSFGALGGDFGVLTINPAGLGDYRSSELVFSFSFNSGNTDSQLQGSNLQNTGHSTQASIENLGLVFHKSPVSGPLVTSNFAIGLQQNISFNENFAFNGQTEGTITERFQDLADGLYPEELDNFEAGLAFDTGAIFDLDNDGFFESDFIESDIVNKSQTVDRSGQINELIFAWGGKFTNNINFGLSVGVPFVSFEEEKNYFENDPNDDIPFFNNLRFTERLTTSGTGVNFKAGIGYTLKRVLRLGFSYQSPTFFKLEDSFNTDLEYGFTDMGVTQDTIALSPDGLFEYRLRTPSRTRASIGGLLDFGDVKGFVNLDAEYVNFGANDFNLTAFTDDPGEAAFEEALNADVEDQLQSAVNINIGTEFVYKKMRVRGGVGFLGDPTQASGEDSKKIFSGGLGYRDERVFIDASYQIRDTEENYVPYRLINSAREQNVSNTSTVSKFTVTIGYKL
ncbi:hypothetical protein N9L92_04660 [Saprospiraceae bacterium]|nr:hypothetical protein [Saprospiraceae bacterium]